MNEFPRHTRIASGEGIGDGWMDKHRLYSCQAMRDCADFPVLQAIRNQPIFKDCVQWAIKLWIQESERQGDYTGSSFGRQEELRVS